MILLRCWRASAKGHSMHSDRHFWAIILFGLVATATAGAIVIAYRPDLAGTDLEKRNRALQEQLAEAQRRSDALPPQAREEPPKQEPSFNTQVASDITRAAEAVGINVSPPSEADKKGASFPVYNFDWEFYDPETGKTARLEDFLACLIRIDLKPGEQTPRIPNRSTNRLWGVEMWGPSKHGLVHEVYHDPNGPPRITEHNVSEGSEWYSVRADEAQSGVTIYLGIIDATTWEKSRSAREHAPFRMAYVAHSGDKSLANMVNLCPGGNKRFGVRPCTGPRP